MKRLIIVLLACLLVSPPLAICQTAPPNTETRKLENPRWTFVEWQQSHESLIEVSTDSGYMGSGVIVRVEPEIQEIAVKGVTGKYHVGYVMTCFHVVAHANNPNNLLIRYTNSCKAKASIYWMDCDGDVAILKTMIPDNYEACKVATENVYGGDTLICIGLGGQRPDISKRETIRRFEFTASDMSGLDWIRSDACIIPGDSGGPVFNQNGELVGLCSCGHERFDKFAHDSIVWPSLFCGPATIRNAMRGLPVETQSK